jgi:Tfp pilus assembly pilus retraction ATPase PilT
LVEIEWISHNCLFQHQKRRIGPGFIGQSTTHEIMIAAPAIRILIREDKIAHMYCVIRTNHRLGVQTLNQDLKEVPSCIRRDQQRRGV